MKDFFAIVFVAIVIIVFSVAVYHAWPGFDEPTYFPIAGRPEASSTQHTQIVSVLEEHKKCEEWGGKFYFSEISSYINQPAGEKISAIISCDKSYDEGNKHIQESLFEYNLKY